MEAKLSFALKQNSQLEGENSQKTHDKFHCNGDCQSFSDFSCLGEKHIDNGSEKNAHIIYQKYNSFIKTKILGVKQYVSTNSKRCSFNNFWRTQFS